MSQSNASPIPDPLSEVTGQLQLWLEQKIPNASHLRISDAVEPAQGFSSRTILFTVSWFDNDTPKQRRLVARIQRTINCPLLADVFHQYRVMEAIRASGQPVAVPSLFAAEPDPSIVGAPFFVMDRVDGRVPSDFPSYHAEGWFAEELSAADREKAWWNGIEEMARLHQISWQQFPFMARGITEAPGAGYYLEHFINRWMDWATQGHEYPLINETIAHMLAHQPKVEQAGLVWNDARLGNTMFAKDLSVASLFDFEVASLGPAEIDLAWWFYCENIFSEQFGHSCVSGIPDRATAIAGFEKIYGREMPHFAYYEAIAALKQAVISIRDYNNEKFNDKATPLPEFALNRLTSYLNENS